MTPKTITAFALLGALSLAATTAGPAGAADKMAMMKKPVTAEQMVGMEKCYGVAGLRSIPKTTCAMAGQGSPGSKRSASAIPCRFMAWGFIEGLKQRDHQR